MINFPISRAKDSITDAMLAVGLAKLREPSVSSECAVRDIYLAMTKERLWGAGEFHDRFMKVIEEINVYDENGGSPTDLALSIIEILRA
jgi:hypothetical protein